jgi:hypothetical protein
MQSMAAMDPGWVAVGLANRPLKYACSLSNEFAPRFSEMRRNRLLALQLLFLRASESMGNHDSKVVDADSVD